MIFNNSGEELKIASTLRFESFDYVLFVSGGRRIIKMCPQRADTGAAAEETGQAGIASGGSGETKLWTAASSNE